MARPIKHDGGLFKRTGSTVWWMQYRDKTGQRQRESTGTEDWNEAQRVLRERLEARDNNVVRTEQAINHLINGTVWIPDSKTVNGVAEVPLTEIAVEACRRQLALSGPGPFLFPSEEDPNKHQKTFKTTWRATLRRAGVPCFRIYDLRSTYATRLSAGGVADEFVTQLLRQGDAKVFKKYSQMKLQMKREALGKLNRNANESGKGSDTGRPN